MSFQYFYGCKENKCSCRIIKGEQNAKRLIAYKQNQREQLITKLNEGQWEASLEAYDTFTFWIQIDIILKTIRGWVEDWLSG